MYYYIKLSIENSLNLRHTRIYGVVKIKKIDVFYW